MKKLILIISFILLMTNLATPQSCLPEGITFNTQTSIDSFQVNFPGCTEIAGGVSIYGEDVTNLSGLNVLTSIGSIYISCPNLSNLEGLNNLMMIYGDVWIEHNLMLVDFSGLENIQVINGSLVINSNGISTLNGLNNLEQIKGSLNLGSIGWPCSYGNYSLTNLSGLEGLTSIEGQLNINHNDSLVDLTGLNNLISIGGSFEVSFNPLLMSLGGLTNLNTINGDIIIKNNSSLQSLDGINSIIPDSINNIRIFENNSLSDCQIQGICDYLADPNGIVDIGFNSLGCNNAPEVASSCDVELTCLPYGNYYFLSQSHIDNFQYDYAGCSSLNGMVIIQGNTIKNLSGLNIIREINGPLQIEYNDSLTDISGLDGLTRLDGSLRIDFNPALTHLEGFNNLDTINGSLSFWENPGITRINGFENLKRINGDLEVSYMVNLLDCPGFSNLESIGASLYLAENFSLTSLASLSSLNAIGGRLVVSMNPSLTSLYGLDNIQAGSISELVMTYNDSLSACAVNSICDYLANPESIVAINANASGCNSENEVEALCEVGVKEQDSSVKQLTASCYPNPTDGIVNFQFTVYGLQSEDVSIKIYDVQGKEVAVVLDQNMAAGEHAVTWDSSSLPAGIYNYRLWAKGAGKVGAGKIVKY